MEKSEAAEEKTLAGGYFFHPLSPLAYSSFINTFKEGVQLMKSLYCPVCGELVLGNAESFSLSCELQCPRCSFVERAAGFSSKLPKHIIVGKKDARCVLTPSFLLAALESCPFPIKRNVPLQPPLKFISEEVCIDDLEFPEVRAIDMREYARSIINSLLLLNSSLLEQRNKALNELERSRRLNKFAGAMRDYLRKEGIDKI